MTDFNFLGKQPPNCTPETCKYFGWWEPCQCDLDHYRGALKEAANALNDALTDGFSDEDDKLGYVSGILAQMRVSLGEVEEKTTPVLSLPKERSGAVVRRKKENEEVAVNEGLEELLEN